MATLDFGSQLQGLDPNFRPLALAFLQAAAEAGLDPRVTEGFRSPERQNELYAQGRTAPGPIVTNAKAGQSRHNSGTAIDVVPGALIDTPNWSPDSPLWSQLAEIGKEAGLEWGGDWKSITDRPHFQMPKGSPSQAPVSVASGEPAPAIKTATVVQDRPVAGVQEGGAQNAVQMPQTVAAQGAGGGDDQKGGMGSVLARLAAGAGTAGQSMGHGAQKPAASSVQGSGNPLGATMAAMAAMEADQKARGLARGLMPDVTALMGLSKRKA